MDIIDDSIEALRKRVQQVVGVIERLKNENNSLRERVKSLEVQMGELTDQITKLKSEREEIKKKIDSAIAMFDELKIGDASE